MAIVAVHSFVTFLYIKYDCSRPGGGEELLSCTKEGLGRFKTTSQVTSIFLMVMGMVIMIMLVMKMVMLVMIMMVFMNDTEDQPGIYMIWM